MDNYPPLIKKSSALLLGCMLCIQFASAQYITIPDTLFIQWINSSGHAGCMNGNQLDTTCPALLADTFFDCHFSSIRDLTGIQYFRNVTDMDCDEAQITILPALPPRLQTLSVFRNHLTVLPPLPTTLTRLYCPHNQLMGLPSLPAGLTYLDCSFNGTLSGLPALPAALTYLNCAYDQIATAMPALPPSLTYLNCIVNRFSSLPVLPSSLQTLLCYYNRLSSIPALPASLIDLECDQNLLSSLPTIPTGLQTLTCNYNQIIALPVMPQTVTYLSAAYNDLTSVANLPDSLDVFYCSHNPHLACLPLIGKIGSFMFDSTAITCLPNYPVVDSNILSNSSPLATSLPLCAAGNANGCAVYTSVHDIAIAGFALYPDPVRDMLTIWYEGEMSGEIAVSIMDAAGRTVISEELAAAEHTNSKIMNVHQLSPGLYFLHLSADGMSYTRRFIKE